MELLQLIASATQHKTIISALITDHFQVPPFSQGDLIDGKIVVLGETGDPTAPTAPFTFDACTGVALTNGTDVIYAAAGGIAAAGNTITFELEVSSAALIEALVAVTDDWIEGFLEVRISANGQDGILLREPVTIVRTATVAADQPEFKFVTAFGPSDVNVAQNRFQLSGHGLVDGDRIQFVPAVSSVLPTPIIENNVYHVVNSSSNMFQIALTQGGTAIVITDSGVGTTAILKEVA
jgi:hypothetical protein